MNQPVRQDMIRPKTKVVTTPVTWYQRNDTRNNQGVLQIEWCVTCII